MTSEQEETGEVREFRLEGATLVVASHDGRIKSAFDHWLDLPANDRAAA